MNAAAYLPQARSGAAIALGVLLGALFILFLAYGQADPCRALAVERARRVDLIVEPWTRAETSQMTTGACIGGLLDSWGERLSHYLPR